MVTPAQKEMTEADLDKEIGEAKGWAHIAYRKWCIDQPDLVSLFLTHANSYFLHIQVTLTVHMYKLLHISSNKKECVPMCVPAFVLKRLGPNAHTQACIHYEYILYMYVHIPLGMLHSYTQVV